MAVTPNYYETLYITRPDIQEEDLAKIQQKLQDSISSNEGEIIKADKWAERNLAYEIQDHKKGIYYILVFKALPNASKEVEKHLQFYRTDILRFITLKTTEEAVNKNKASEEKKEKTEPTTPTPPPAAPTTTAAPTPPPAAPEPPTAAPEPPPAAPEPPTAAPEPPPAAPEPPTAAPEPAATPPTEASASTEEAKTENTDTQEEGGTN